MGRSYKKLIVAAALILCALPGLLRAQSLMLGTTYGFRISYANTGTISWGPTTISLQLPPELTYVSCSGAVCSESSGLIQWDIPSVPYGQSGYVTFSAYVNTCTTNNFNIQGEINVSSPSTIVYTNVLSYNVACQTNTPTNTPTITDTPTVTDTPTPSFTPTVTDTLTPTSTPTDTPTPTDSFTPTSTATITPTATVTPTDTPTSTPTITATPTNTFTPTATLVPLHVWPDPFDPDTAVGGVLKAYQVPTGSTLDIYTVSGEWVNREGEVNGLITWDGRNQSGVRVSGGVYYFVIRNGPTVILAGKFLVRYD